MGDKLAQQNLLDSGDLLELYTRCTCNACVLRWSVNRPLLWLSCPVLSLLLPPRSKSSRRSGSYCDREAVNPSTKRRRITLGARCKRLNCIAGVISRGTRGNAVPIVENLPERMGTAFPFLKCLRTHKTHLKLRKKNKNALTLTLCQAKSRSSVDSYENH